MSTASVIFFEQKTLDILLLQKNFPPRLEDKSQKYCDLGRKIETHIFWGVLVSVMSPLVQFTQFVFCLVSMTLTSLFAFSLSGITFEEVGGGFGSEKEILSACLFVLIGVCIDFGKYLFWVQGNRHVVYVGISIVLTGFSLLASCAFFVSAEISTLNDTRLVSSEYLAFQERVDSVKQEIAFQERLLEKRLDSQYHSQWEEGERNSQQVAELKETLANLIERSEETGQDTAISKVPITNFFAALGSMVNIEADIIRNIFYGLLALLLEISTLGAISLARSIQTDDESECNGVVTEQASDDPEIREKVARLSEDIVTGRVQPVVRRIKAAHYGLDLDEVRQVLANLYSVGLIEQGARNSYKLKRDT